MQSQRLGRACVPRDEPSVAHRSVGVEVAWAGRARCHTENRECEALLHNNLLGLFQSLTSDQVRGLCAQVAMLSMRSWLWGRDFVAEVGAEA